MPNRKPRRVGAFIQISLDGYYCDSRGDMTFAHKAADDAEWQQFTTENASGGGMLLFGRITYEMMAALWPTPMAGNAMPEVAARMNAMPKLVFSRTLRSADWTNTKLIKDDPIETIRRMKHEAGPDMAILGSGSIVTQLAGAGLIDTFQVVVSKASPRPVWSSA